MVVVMVMRSSAMLGSRGNGLDLSDEAKLNLYETIGHLIGMPSVPVTAQARFVLLPLSFSVVVIRRVVLSH